MTGHFFHYTGTHPPLYALKWVCILCSCVVVVIVRLHLLCSLVYYCRPFNVLLAKQNFFINLFLFFHFSYFSIITVTVCIAEYAATAFLIIIHMYICMYFCMYVNMCIHNTFISALSFIYIHIY